MFSDFRGNYFFSDLPGLKQHFGGRMVIGSLWKIDTLPLSPFSNFEGTNPTMSPYHLVPASVIVANTAQPHTGCLLVMFAFSATLAINSVLFTINLL